MQDTNFCFEVLINDDCSTDNTADIIADYHRKYPRILKPRYHTENQHSRGIKPDAAFNYPRARGSLIALCEGDDYWTDPLKLQKQASIFKTYTNASLCFHSANELNELTGSTEIICNHLQESQRVPTADVILGRGGYMPTASLMFRNTDITALRELLEFCPISDYFLQVFKASLGDTYFLDEPMCVYRRNAVGSWTRSQLDDENRRLFSLSMVGAIDRMSSLLPEKNDRKTLYKMMQYYSSSYVANTKEIRKKITAAKQLTEQAKNYNKLIFSSYIFLIVTASIARSLIK